MLLERASIRNFQSIEEADIEFGKLTVVVGASSSGKSALLRALRTLVMNASSPAFVTHGEKSALVSLLLDDGVARTKVSLERGKGLSTYALQLEGETEVKFTKCGTAVPPEIATVFAMPVIEDEYLNFAFQFDRPFLLSEPATKVAKVLGDLTNINVLYEAVREASRRHRETSAKLKVRSGDLDTLRERVQQFADLPKRRKAIVSARELYDEALERSETVKELDSLIDRTSVAQTALDELQAQSLRQVEVDTTVLDERHAAVVGLRALIDKVWATSKELAAAKKELAVLDQEVSDLDAKYHDKLVETGTCPVCGQKVKA